MYYLYSVDRKPRETHFIREKETHLFGRIVGEIPRLLRRLLTGTENPPYPWHLSIENALAPDRQSLIIDLKPNNKDQKGSLSLYELRDVWGFSDPSWTPGMLRLRGIIVDGEPSISNALDFAVEPDHENESIYTFLHFDGTITGGELKGNWTAPRQSSTNSALLWPYALSYFLAEIRKTTPDIFEP